MLLRSSSTPILKSLLSSLSDNPNSTPHHHETPAVGRNSQTPIHHLHNHSKPSFHHAAGSLNLSSFSCNSSPISPSINTAASAASAASTGFRRAQSEGNLKGLTSVSCSNFDGPPNDLKPPPRPSRRPSCPVLQTIPSFSFRGSNGRSEEDSDDDEIEEREGIEEKDGLMEKSVVEGGKGSFTMGQDDEFKVVKKKVGLIEEVEIMNGFESLSFQGIGEQMYLAKGLGVGGGDFTQQDFDLGGGDGTEIEEYYRRLVEENPGSPLFLRNYAQFLYHSKRDPQKAEEYYSRAILADPTDGEILSQYAKLTWELHRDEDRTSSYFERAVQAAPEDSHVHSAYASFLWEAEEDEEEDEEEDIAPKDNEAVPQLYQNRTMASASA